MTVKRKDFQKTAAYIHQFLLKLDEGNESAEVRDALNLALLHMQKFFRWLQRRMEGHENSGTLSHTSLRGLSPMTPFHDRPDRFMFKWLELDNQKHLSITMALAKEHGISASIPLIHSAAKSGDLGTLIDLYHKNPGNVDEVDGLGRSPLMYAVHYDQREVVDWLLGVKVDLNAASHDQTTVLHLACYEGKWKYVELFVQQKANLNAQDAFGRAPLHWSVCSTTTESLKILLKNGANPRIQDKDNVTPSMYACRLDNIDHFIILDKAVSNLTNEYSDGLERDRFGQTNLHWSVRRTEPLECLKTLISKHTAVVVDDEGKNVLHTAAEQGSLASCRIILDVVGNVIINDRDGQDRTPLHLASEGGHGEVLNFLLERGANMENRDKDGATVWDYAKQRQLNYCMLILGSHYRQRSKELEMNASQTSLQETKTTLLKSTSLHNMSTSSPCQGIPVLRPRTNSGGPLFMHTNKMPVESLSQVSLAASHHVVDGTKENINGVVAPAPKSPSERGKRFLLKQVKMDGETDAETVIYEGVSEEPDLQELTRDYTSPLGDDVEVDPRPPTTPPPKRDKSPSNRILRGTSRENSCESQGHQSQNGFDFKEDDNDEFEMNAHPIDPLTGLVNVNETHSEGLTEHNTGLENMNISPSEEQVPMNLLASRPSYEARPPGRSGTRAMSSSPVHVRRPAPPGQTASGASSPERRHIVSANQGSPERPFLRIQPPLKFNRSSHAIPTGSSVSPDPVLIPSYQEAPDEADPAPEDEEEDANTPSHPPRTPPDRKRRPGYPPQLMPLQHAGVAKVNTISTKKKKKKKRSETAPEVTNGVINVQASPAAPLYPPGYVEPLQAPVSPRGHLNPSSSAPAYHLRSRQMRSNDILASPESQTPSVTPRGTAVLIPPPQGFGNASKENSPRSATSTGDDQSVPMRPNGPTVLLPNPGRPRPHHRSATAGQPARQQPYHWGQKK